MKKRYYFCLKPMRWIYDALEEENEESIKLKCVVAIARYIMENPDKIRNITKEEFES